MNDFENRFAGVESIKMTRAETALNDDGSLKSNEAAGAGNQGIYLTSPGDELHDCRSRLRASKM